MTSGSCTRARAKFAARARSRTARAAAILALFVAVRPAAGADEPPTPPDRKTPTDTSTKRASLEMATYKDTDHVTVFTPSIGASIENITAGASLRGRYLVDVVSAASVDIVSTASRRWVETRHAGSLEGEYKPHDFGIAVSGGASSEPDYLSYNVGARMMYDLDAKNTTLLLGYGYSHDTAGRHDTPFSVFARDLTRTTYNGGLTQIIDRSTVLGIGFDVVIENGDQSKPYRYVPMFAPSVAASAPAGASIEWVTTHRLPERPLEQLPLTRRRFALTSRLAHRFEGSTVRVSERIYDDTWGLFGSTTDARWIFDVGRRFAFWPHARFHIQTPVGFWQRAYVSRNAGTGGWDLPEFRTGDRELGPLYTATSVFGIKLFAGSDAEPHAWAISLQGDAMYTAYSDSIYLTSRTSFLGALVLDGEL